LSQEFSANLQSNHKKKKKISRPMDYVEVNGLLLFLFLVQIISIYLPPGFFVHPPDTDHFAVEAVCTLVVPPQQRMPQGLAQELEVDIVVGGPVEDDHVVGKEWVQAYEIALGTQSEYFVGRDFELPDFGGFWDVGVDIDAGHAEEGIQVCVGKVNVLGFGFGILVARHCVLAKQCEMWIL